MSAMFRLGALFGSALSLAAPMVTSAMLTATVYGPSRPQSTPPGSQRVEMLSVDFRNDGTEDVDVQSMRVLHRGLGERSDILGVYAMDDSGERLSDRYGFESSDGIADIRFRPALTVPARGGVSVHVLADISPDASIAGEHRLWLSSADDIDAGDATVTVQQGAAAAQTVRTAGSERATIDVEYPRLNERVRFGDDQLVGRLRLSADGHETQFVTSIVLTNEGKARKDDLKRIVIVSNRGQYLSNVAASLGGRNGDRVVLTFDPPLRIDGGSSVSLNIHADVKVSRKKTIRFVVQEPNDIQATVQRAMRR